MLAELRALGEGIIIADQLPSAVAPEVVKNTGTKLAHRLVSNEDRKDLGGAMLLGDTEIEEIARLKPGEAYFYPEGLHLPRRVRCLNANAYLELSEFISSDSLASFITKEEWFNNNKDDRRLSFANAVRKAEQEAVNAFREHQSDLNKLKRKHQDIIDEKEYKSEEEFRKEKEQLKQDCDCHAISVGETFDTLKARFDILETLSRSSNDGLAVSAENAFRKWEEDLRPGLVELQKDFYTIKDDL